MTDSERSRIRPPLRIDRIADAAMNDDGTSATLTVAFTNGAPLDFEIDLELLPGILTSLFQLCVMAGSRRPAHSIAPEIRPLNTARMPVHDVQPNTSPSGDRFLTYRLGFVDIDVPLSDAVFRDKLYRALIQTG